MNELSTSTPNRIWKVDCVIYNSGSERRFEWCVIRNTSGRRYGSVLFGSRSTQPWKNKTTTTSDVFQLLLLLGLTHRIRISTRIWRTEESNFFPCFFGGINLYFLRPCCTFSVPIPIVKWIVLVVSITCFLWFSELYKSVLAAWESKQDVRDYQGISFLLRW